MQKTCCLRTNERLARPRKEKLLRQFRICRRKKNFLTTSRENTLLAYASENPKSIYQIKEEIKKKNKKRSAKKTEVRGKTTTITKTPMR